MKILVTGAQGQLGQDVMKVLQDQNLDLLGTDRDTLDITDARGVQDVFLSFKPDVVVHCAAYTAVDQAEKDKDLCFSINVLGTRILAENCRDFGAKMVYISTDYVFNGQGEEPFAADDEPNPVNYYGETKYQGELEVKKVLSDYFILRISWVFGVYGNNFVKTMLRLGQTKKEISVVSDQIGSPTYTKDVADMILSMIQTEKYGTYHQTNQGYCSWAEFAAAIFEKAGLDCQVNPILTKDYPTAAKRPLNSRMVTAKTFQEFGLKQRDWTDALEAYLEKSRQIEVK